MAWYYEIVGHSDLPLEQSEPVYQTQWEAEWAGYQRFKDRQALETGLRRVPFKEQIRAKWKVRTIESILRRSRP